MPVKTILWIIIVYTLSFLCYLPMLLRRLGVALPDAVLGTKYLFVIVPALVTAVFLVGEHKLKTDWAGAIKRITLKECILCLLTVIAGVFTTSICSFVTNTDLFQKNYPSIIPFAASCIYLFTTALLEEAAWRGYLFKQMLAANGKFPAAALLAGAAWAVWHIPMWTIRNSLGLKDTALLLIWTVLVSLALSAAYGIFGNLLSAAFLHMAFNVFWLAPVLCNEIILSLTLIIFVIYRKIQKGMKEYTQ